MTKLDEIAINIELVLISLIQGVALVVLAQQAVHALGDPEWYSYISYLLSGLALLLVFWTQAVLHALSFIRWPVRVEHVFLYFTAALVQMIAYANLENITMWFFLWGLFSIVTFGIYIIDLWIMRETYKSFAKLKGGEAYLKSVEQRHLFEMKFLVPAALVFNIVVWILALVFPWLFYDPWIYAIPGFVQFAFTLYILFDLAKTFRSRSALIAGLFVGDK